MTTHATSVAFGVASVLALASVGAAADVVVADFEGGIPEGWTATPSGWMVGGTTGTSPNINPTQGALFARCGAPNVSSEFSVGTLTSGPITVRSGTLEWTACGWSGQFGNGLNRFEILDAELDVLVTVAAPLSDQWTARSVNLAALGIGTGDVIYFRAVDTLAVANYAWLAVDFIRFTGVTCPADLNGSGAVDGADLGLMLANWAGSGTGDLDASGTVDGADLGSLLAAWGACGP